MLVNKGTKNDDSGFMREVEIFCKEELQKKSEDLENNKYFGDVHNNNAQLFPFSLSTIYGHNLVEKLIMCNVP